MEKQNFLQWNNLIAYIRENLIDGQAVSKDMIAEIKALMDYINALFASESDEKMNYEDLLEIFKQAEGMIKTELDGKVYASVDVKFISVCDCIRQYLDLVFSEQKEKMLQAYCTESSGISANVSITIPATVNNEYNSKLAEIRQREDATRYREFTKLGAFATYILAVSKGLIGFKKHGEQIYLTAKDGFLCTEQELAALPNN